MHLGEQVNQLDDEAPKANETAQNAPTLVTLALPHVGASFLSNGGAIDVNQGRLVKINLTGVWLSSPKGITLVLCGHAIGNAPIAPIATSNFEKNPVAAGFFFV